MAHKPTSKGVVFYVFKGVGLVLAASVCGLIGAVLSRNVGTSSYTISYADFVSVMLSAVTLVMTLLGFILALLAYVGWRELNERIDAKVVGRTTEFLEDGFREGNSLHRMLEKRWRRAAYSGVEPIETDDEESDGE